MKALWTARKLGEFLGFSPEVVYDWAQRGRLPCLKLGRQIRFVPEEIFAWMNRQRRVGTESQVAESPDNATSVNADSSISGGACEDGP
jgi:excisionase family DNA binding protein